VDASPCFGEATDLMPEHLIAIVVGIDHYSLGPFFRLSTPAKDALRFVDCLLERHVPMDRIKLFLSEESWREESVREWIAARGWTGGELVANRIDITDLVNVQLVDADPDAILLFWGGHGFVNRAGRQQVFTADAHERAPYSVAIDDIVTSLRRNALGRLRQITCLVDACAIAYSIYGLSEKSVPIGLTIPENPNLHVTHVGGYAASSGKQANGRFSQVLLQRLTQAPATEWPDFATILTEIADQGALGAAAPRFELIAGRERRVVESPATLPLSSAKEAVARTGVQDTLVYRLYTRSLPQSADALAWPLAPEKALDDLNDHHPRHPGAPGPLFEFMMRLEHEFKHEALTAWIDRYVTVQQQEQLTRVLEKGDRASDYARLFIEIDRKLNQVRWFVQSPDPAQSTAVHEVEWNGDISPQSMGPLLTSIVQQAQALPVALTHPIAISLLLQWDLLTSGIENTPIQLGEDFDGPATPLIQHYPVMLHWLDRARWQWRSYGHKQSIQRWRELLRHLESQLAGDGAAAIKWVDTGVRESDAPQHAAGAAAHLRNDYSAEVCIALPYPDSGLQPDVRAMVLACLREGIPCFSWISAAPADRAQLHGEISRKFSEQTASRAPFAIAEYIKTCAGRNESGQTLRVVWDDERMLPTVGIYLSPEDPT
jgi:hypothetical protein